MLVCNTMQQSQFATKVETQKTAYKEVAVEIHATKVMPCHQPMTNLSKVEQLKTHNKTHGDNHKSPYKSNCASICANMCALTAIPGAVHSVFALNLTQLFSLNHQSYASITQPNLQRPPIAFI